MCTWRRLFYQHPSCRSWSCLCPPSRDCGPSACTFTPPSQEATSQDTTLSSWSTAPMNMWLRTSAGTAASASWMLKWSNITWIHYAFPVNLLLWRQGTHPVQLSRLTRETDWLTVKWRAAHLWDCAFVHFFHSNYLFIVIAFAHRPGGKWENWFRSCLQLIRAQQLSIE